MHEAVRPCRMRGCSSTSRAGPSSTMRPRSDAMRPLPADHAQIVRDNQSVSEFAPQSRQQLENFVSVR